MKFFWKIYFSFMILFLLSFGFFGTWMIQMTFEKSYQRVLEEGERSNRMFQLAFEMNLNALDEIYQTEEMIPVTGTMVTQNLSEPGTIYRIYDEQQYLLYESQTHGCKGNVLTALTMDSSYADIPCGHETVRYRSQTWLIFTCRSETDGRTYFLESLKDISDIYREREDYYDWYAMIMMILTIVVTILVFLVTHFLTRSIGELSQKTRRFTSGDYEVRASEKGGDEIAELACDFNDMADTISDKMEELTLQAKKQEDFTASFAHELKTPLTSIIGYADMIRSMGCTEEETMEAANYIFQQGKRLESLSFKLLELIVADKQEYQFRSLSVQKLLEEAIQLTEVKREEKQIQLSVFLEPGQIMGEKDLLLSALTNLLDNARKAVKENGKIRIQGRNLPDEYLLSISDNGCGMEQEEVTRITEAFYMVDKSRARKEGGAGLGMTLCSRILSLHNARWKIFSIPGKGTSIGIQFSKEVMQDDTDT